MIRICQESLYYANFEIGKGVIIDWSEAEVKKLRVAVYVGRDVAIVY